MSSRSARDSDRPAGCAARLGAATEGFASRTLDVLGTPRTYHLHVPRAYDTESRVYPVVFVWHGHGGDGVSGGLNHWLACVRGDVLRASAGIAVRERAGACVGKAAAWLLHDHDDETVAYEEGEAARARELARNGRSGASEPLGSDCVRYLECDESHPVVWCATRDYGHHIRGDWAPAQVWSFFESLD